MRALHLLLALALALFAAGAPAANSADIKRQFPTLDKNKIVVKLWPTKRGKEHDNGWSYREVSLDAEQCVNFSDIGPGHRFNGISSLRQYPHQYGSRYYCKYYHKNDCETDRVMLLEGVAYWPELGPTWSDKIFSMRCVFCLAEDADHKCLS